jgi:hypothetical protein
MIICRFDTFIQTFLCMNMMIVCCLFPTVQTLFSLGLGGAFYNV